MQQYILASASPRRRELLKKILDEFTVQPSEAEETLPPTVPLEQAAAYLSQCKAKAVSKKHPEAIVIGCDTVVLIGNHLLGKPKDSEQARTMLQALSGKTHRVITGLTVTNGSRTETISSETAVTFYPLSEAEIDEYLATGEPFDKAGAYGIQGKGALFVREISGDYCSVMGLPVASLYHILKEFDSDLKI